MSVCAGSSTERTRRLYLLCSPGTVRPARAKILLKYFAGRFRWTARPAGQGFMSTQRRENRWQRTSCTGRAGVLGMAFAGPIAWHARAAATVGTAPPSLSASFHPSDNDPSPGAPDWSATNSLQSEYSNLQLARQNIRRSSPPPGAGCGAAFDPLATHRSSFSRIPSHSGLVCLHPTLPRFPAGKRRWTERYDGKGNLHLLYAA